MTETIEATGLVPLYDSGAIQQFKRRSYCNVLYRFAV